VKNNALSHAKAAKDLKIVQMHQDLRIQLANWPFNSPDLNKVKPLWGYLKDSLVKWDIKRASQKACDRAKQAVLIE